jgi:GDPmannose 4,6-dehydratase
MTNPLQKTALITGITGQDGAYLAEFLLAKGYAVHGLRRRASTDNLARLRPLLATAAARERLILHDGDVTDSASVIRILQAASPDEVYNLAAQSDVRVSFEAPELTSDIGGLGALRLLEAIRLLGLGARTRFYQASTSELYGLTRETPQSEKTPFHPRSPYGAAKLYAYWITVNYREAYGFHASNGVLFNHESPLRGENFVTRKITRAAAAISLGLQDRLLLGNLEARRDWGHARDYVEGMWLMLQQPRPDDYVLATGVSHSVRQMAELAFAEAGLPLVWRGAGAEEAGVHEASGRVLVVLDPHLLRPSEVHHLVGDCAKARETLGWRARTSFAELVREMVQADRADLRARVPGS